MHLCNSHQEIKEVAHQCKLHQEEILLNHMKLIERKKRKIKFNKFHRDKTEDKTISKKDQQTE